ncbi:MAG: formate dehydrogenase [Actinomycetales bacterium]|nr:formate dehydrogenase [Actinomycetales bacterium]
MSQSSETAQERTLPRFSRGERWVHRSIAIDMGVLLITAALLYFPSLAGVVGNRQIVRVIHEAAGWVIPVLLLLALLSAAFRADAGRLNRFRPSDWEWLRSRDRRSGRLPVGKFNAGQKLNAAFTLGAILVMLGSGAIMFFSSLFTDAIRTGATFVHDWLALAVAVVVIGHMYMAFKDATARMGMRTGEVPEDWARREHRAWAEETLDATTAPPSPRP